MEQPDDRHSLKRKRSSDLDQSGSPVVPPKTAKTTNHLAINYLARQRTEDTPLLSTEDTLPSLIQTLGEYAGILDRHESMAFNLGAKPLGPILVRRFEKLFDGPPKVLTSHGKEKTSISWLDVVEFARNKPEQFALAQMSEGARVCQIHLKQCRVQISEEDFVLISSGMPQKLIPPQPVLKDEEQELGTLEILEQCLGTIVQMADQVAAKGRQLRHRIGSRKQAILDRRAADPANATPRPPSPSNIALMNSVNGVSSGFVAVNSRPTAEGNGSLVEPGKGGASEATRNELLKQFASVKQLRRMNTGEAVFMDNPPHPVSQNVAGTPIVGRDDSPSFPRPLKPGPNPNAYSASTPPHQKDNDGPYKTEMIARVEAIKRGDRILPPCDRCRRLHMDCVKNLTACLGCTKKHAKCSWRDVRAFELTAPISQAASVPEVETDHNLEYLRRATQDPPNSDTRLTTNGLPGNQHDAPSNTIALSAAAAGLAAVAKASTAALEFTEAELQQGRPGSEHRSQIAQSPNIIQSSTHQSPNISNFGSFSPPHTSHSVNMPYASNRRRSSPALAPEDHGSSDLKYDVHGSDAMDLRNGDGLLAS